MSAIRILQVLPNPGFDISDLWEGVPGRLLACVKLSEADAEADLVNIGIWNQIIGCGRYRRVDEELEQALCGQTPAFGVTVDEGLRLA